MRWPSARAAISVSLVTVSALGLPGLISTLIIVFVGSNSLSNSRRLGNNKEANWLTPVTLPSGRLKLETRPSFIGSPPTTNTIGMVEVASLAASATGEPTDGGNYRHLTANEFRRQRPKAVVLAFRPSVFDRQILTFYVQPD